MTDKELFERVARSSGQRAGYKQLVRELGLGGGRERRLLLEQLDRLTASGQLVKIDRELWAVALAARKRNNWVSGRLDLHRDGYGFVRPDTREKQGKKISLFLPIAWRAPCRAIWCWWSCCPHVGTVAVLGVFYGCWSAAIQP